MRIRKEEPRDSRAQPPLGWGSPLVTKDTLLDHHHQLQGTWTREHAGTEGEDLGARGEPAHLLAIPQEVEPPRQYTVPAFSNRPLSRSVILPRSARKVRGRPRIQNSSGSLDVCSSLLPSPFFTCRVVEADTSVRGNRVEVDNRLPPSLHWLVRPVQPAGGRTDEEE